MVLKVTLVNIESSSVPVVGNASIFHWWFCWRWCCIINNQTFGSFLSCWLLDLLTFWRAHGSWYSYSSTDYGINTSKCNWHPNNFCAFAAIVIYIFIIYSHDIINSLSRNQWILSLLIKWGLQVKSVEAYNKLLNEQQRKKFIKAFCLQIIFDCGVLTSSHKVTNLEDICKQIEKEFHMRVHTYKPLMNQMKMKLDKLSENPWRQWFSNLCFMRTSPLWQWCKD